MLDVPALDEPEARAELRSSVSKALSEMAAVAAAGLSEGTQDFSGAALVNDVFGSLGSFRISVDQPLWDAASSGDVQIFGRAFTSEVDKYVRVVAVESHWGAFEVIAMLLTSIKEVHGRDGLREVMSIVQQLGQLRD